MNIVDNVLGRDVLIDRPSSAVSLAVEELGVGVVQEPGEGVLDVER